jgi:aldose 1-epimerase
VTGPPSTPSPLAGEGRGGGDRLPSGEQFEIRHGDQRAVAVAVGGGLRWYERAARPLIAGYPENEPARSAMGLPLVPWPNRIRDGRYTFGGRELQLPITEPERGNSIHGLARRTPWRATERRPDSVTLSHLIEPTPGYPFRLACSVTYSLDSSGLSCVLGFENRGDGPLPVGAGHHPYFRAGDPPVDRWRLRLPARSWLELDERMIPTGSEPDVAGTDRDFTAGREIGALVLDTAYTRLEADPDGLVRAALTAPEGGGLSVWMGPGTTHVMVYTGDAIGRAGLAIEPMSCPPNAFQSGDGVRVLVPGERWTFAWGVEPG